MSYIALPSDGSQYEDYSVQTTVDDRELMVNHILDNYVPDHSDYTQPESYTFNGVEYD